MASFELIYPSLSHLPCLSSYKLHHLSLTRECSQAFPYWRPSNEALWVTWQRASRSDECCILSSVYLDALHHLWVQFTVLRIISGSPTQLWNCQDLLDGWDQQVFQIYAANLREVSWTQKNFQMTENTNKQLQNKFLGWHLANGI